MNEYGAQRPAHTAKDRATPETSGGERGDGGAVGRTEPGEAPPGHARAPLTPGRDEERRELAQREDVREEVRHEMHARSPEGEPPAEPARRMSMGILVGVALAGAIFLAVSAITLEGWVTLVFAGVLLVGYIFLAMGLPRLIPDTMRQHEQQEAEEIVIHRHEVQEGTAPR